MSRKWENILIGPENTIRKALEVIDREGLRGAIIVDANKRLLGVVSDGDIRRGILSGNSLTDSVSMVMNKQPLITAKHERQEYILRLMKSKELLLVPIVDDGVVIGLRTLYESLAPQKVNNPVFLMAGGFGTRLRPLTNNCPKPLLKVGGKPILEIILLNFIKSGFVNFYISTHYLPEMISNHFGDGSKWGINITYAHEDTPLGTAGALGLLPNNIPKLPLIMMNADILTNVNFRRLLDFHASESADVTMCVKEYEYMIPYGVVQGHEGKLTNMLEKPVHVYSINAGVYVLNPDIVEKVKSGVVLDMSSLLEMNIEINKNIMMFPIHEYWRDIGQMEDYVRAQSDVHMLDIN